MAVVRSIARREPTLLAFLLAVAATTYWHLYHWAFVDFVSALYCPLVSFLSGQNPYDATTYVHPVQTRFAYPPLTLLMHLPLGLFSLGVAQTIHYAANLVLTPLLAIVALRLAGIPRTTTAVFGLAALIVVSRPGHANIVQGQTAALIVIATYLALLLARRRPWVAGCALAVATAKPTVGIPLALLMLARRDVRAVAIGVTVTGIVSAVPLGMIIGRAGGVEAFVRLLAENYQIFTRQMDNGAFSSPYRLDAVALIARLAGQPLGLPTELAISLGVLLLGAWGVARVPPGAGEQARRLSASLICVTVLACVYHQGYDGLLLALPLTALVKGRWAPRRAATRATRWTLIALLAVPAANHLATYGPLNYLGITGGWWIVVTSLNGAALLGALLTYVLVATRTGEPQERATVDDELSSLGYAS